MKIGDRVAIVKLDHPVTNGEGVLLQIQPPNPTSPVYPRDYPLYEVGVLLTRWVVYVFERADLQLLASVPLGQGRPLVARILDDIESRGCPMRFGCRETWESDERGETSDNESKVGNGE